MPQPRRRPAHARPGLRTSWTMLIIGLIAAVAAAAALGVILLGVPRL